ncbi:hypothetical protein PR048_015578 [Dryococelus australis]|uniref:Uncharacterized protein n=1 Tax=Dryococelus australis TaxID=614101 RepID=A0ABQ9HHC4_9NEOP|nr:hypothetical protein PR048_015578 [Dryococelus australis]
MARDKEPSQHSCTERSRKPRETEAGPGSEAMSYRMRVRMRHNALCQCREVTAQLLSPDAPRHGSGRLKLQLSDDNQASERPGSTNAAKHVYTAQLTERSRGLPMSGTMVLTWISAGIKEREKRQIPEKTRRPVASSGTILTCENPGMTRLGIEPGGEQANHLVTAAPIAIWCFIYALSQFLRRNNMTASEVGKRGYPQKGLRWDLFAIPLAKLSHQEGHNTCTTPTSVRNKSIFLFGEKDPQSEITAYVMKSAVLGRAMEEVVFLLRFGKMKIAHVRLSADNGPVREVFWCHNGTMLEYMKAPIHVVMALHTRNRHSRKAKLADEGGLIPRCCAVSLPPDPRGLVTLLTSPRGLTRGADQVQGEGVIPGDERQPAPIVPWRGTRGMNRTPARPHAWLLCKRVSGLFYEHEGKGQRGSGMCGHDRSGFTI